MPPIIRIITTIIRTQPMSGASASALLENSASARAPTIIAAQIHM
jgi:hypothetical protein